MKFMLIVYLTFHFEAMPVATQTEFQTKQLCEDARAVISRSLVKSPDQWGRQRLAATCVQVKE